MTRCGAELDKLHFRGLRRRETLNRPIPARAGGTVDQNWAKLGQNLAKRPVGSKCGEIGEAKRKFQLKEAIRV
jgi:hypothetical protein